MATSPGSAPWPKARKIFEGEKVSRLFRDLLTLDINTSGGHFKKSVA